MLAKGMSSSDCNANRKKEKKKKEERKTQPALPHSTLTDHTVFKKVRLCSYLSTILIHWLTFYNRLTL